MTSDEHPAVAMAWLEGREAAIDPAGAEADCPFSPFTAELVLAWNAGYDEARRELRLTHEGAQRR
jgi:hypothetical protein